MRALRLRTHIVRWFLAVALAARGQTDLVTKSVQEADLLEKQIADSDRQNSTSLHYYFENIRLGLQRAQSQPGKINQIAAGPIATGLFGLSGYMQKPNSAGKDTYFVLCLDLLKILAASGFVNPAYRAYCPAADGLYASLAAAAPQSKQGWSDITEKKNLSYRDGQDILQRALRGRQAPQFRVPGILGQVYAGQFANVADDLNTRNYIGSIVSRYPKPCPQYDTPSNAFATSKYFAYYEMKAQEKMTRSASANNPDAFVKSFASIFRVLTAHGSQGGIEDGDMMIHSFGCNGPLFENILNLAQSQNDLPPDVPNNAFFRAQLNPALDLQVEFSYNNSDSAIMRAVRKSCEGIMTDLGSNNVVGRGQEGYCRCQAQMVV